MTHDEVFLQDILAQPEDDAPRLVYADWLEEHGRSERAELIRTQVALAGMGPGDLRRWPLLARERQLVATHGKGWAGPLRRLVRRWQFRRGFVEAVTLPAADFLRRGEDLFRLAPLRRVRLTTAADLLGELALCPLLGRLSGLDLRHTQGMTIQRLQMLLNSRYLDGLRSLGLRGTGACNGPGLRALGRCPRLTGLTELDVSDYRRDVERGLRSAYRAGLTRGGHWHEQTRTSVLDEGAMRALAESTFLGELRSLGLSGYGVSLHPEARDCFLQSSLLGRLDTLDLSMDFARDDGPSFLARLARCPQASGLRVLRLRRIHGPVGGHWRVEFVGWYLEGLVSLELEDAWPPINALGDGAFPNLVELRLRGTYLAPRTRSWPDWGRLLVGTKRLPRLALLDLLQTTLTPEAIEGLAGGPLLGQLRWLSLGNRSGSGSRPMGSDLARRLVQSEKVSNLVHLDLGNHDLDDAAAQAVAESPHLGRLASLNLWHNRIGLPGAMMLAASRSLPSLAALDLRSNPIPPWGRDKLRERFGAGVLYGPGRHLTDDGRRRR
jgi:uncharacterized protein (TIGR02996 family)